MRRFSRILAGLLAGGLVVAAAQADTIKVGVIGTMSGPYALFGRNFKYGIDAFVAEHGNRVGNHTVEFIYKDEESPNPARARSLAQELLVKDKVQYLAGFYFTPDALAAVPLLEETRTPMIVMNAATSSITEKSPYIVRTGFTIWQMTVPAARAAIKDGVKKVAIAVSDYAPGLDAETAFRKTFEAEGGSVVETIRMPLSTTDFSPVVQRIKASGADAIFCFMPAGPPTIGLFKAYVDNGLKAAGIKLLATGDLVTEADLPAAGDASLGVISSFHYALSHDSAENKAFLELLGKVGAPPDQVVMTSVAAYDGARLIYKMIEATEGRRDPATAVEAVKGMSWVSPRGPVSIDPATRHIRQNIYIRVVEKVDGRYVNRETGEVYADQPDWGLVK
ncbi:MAG: ABC transporter substrate-binding protein [Alphaproteobacteria bacterium]|nr:ABC transporter substrate-binding protein [Alphaproteobacteria bacterium]